jgi:hypothetical protein
MTEQYATTDLASLTLQELEQRYAALTDQLSTPIESDDDPALPAYRRACDDLTTLKDEILQRPIQSADDAALVFKTTMSILGQCDIDDHSQEGRFLLQLKPWIEAMQDKAA